MKILPIINETNDEKSTFPSKTYPTMFAEYEHLVQLYNKAFLLVHDGINPVSGKNMVRRVVHLSGTKTILPTDSETKPGYIKVELPVTYGYASVWVDATTPNIDKILRQVERAGRYAQILKTLRAKIADHKREIQKSKLVDTKNTTT
jgi:hypothetical protein